METKIMLMFLVAMTHTAWTAWLIQNRINEATDKITEKLDKILENQSR